MARKMHAFLIGIECILLVIVLYQLDVIAGQIPFIALTLVSALLVHSLYLLFPNTANQ